MITHTYFYETLQLNVEPQIHIAPNNTNHTDTDPDEEVCNDGYLRPGVICGTTDNVQPNGEFNLDKYYAIKHEKYYSCCPDSPYQDVTYYVLLRRRPMFYVFNLILPCVLINSIGKEG